MVNAYDAFLAYSAFYDHAVLAWNSSSTGIDCPRCGAKGKEDCCTPGGRKFRKIGWFSCDEGRDRNHHEERRLAWMDLVKIKNDYSQT